MQQCCSRQAMDISTWSEEDWKHRQPGSGISVDHVIHTAALCRNRIREATGADWQLRQRLHISGPAERLWLGCGNLWGLSSLWGFCFQPLYDALPPLSDCSTTSEDVTSPWQHLPPIMLKPHFSETRDKCSGLLWDAEFFHPLSALFHQCVLLRLISSEEVRQPPEVSSKPLLIEAKCTSRLTTNSGKRKTSLWQGLSPLGWPSAAALIHPHALGGQSVQRDCTFHLGQPKFRACWRILFIVTLMLII